MGDLPLLGTNAQIIRIVEALFGVQPGNTYFTNFQDFAEETSLDALSNALVGALAPADAESLAATVAANYQVDPELETEDGSNVIELLETYITAQLNTVPEAEWGAKILEITNQYTNLWTDPLLGESVTAFNDAVVASLVYSANPANTEVNDPDGGPVTGDDINLTLAQDNLVGTDANDTFNAFIFNNSNTLQSGDTIDGGAGMDTLFADIGNSQSFAITPHTNSVEKLLVRAQAISSDSNENNMHNGVQIDAERMVGTDWYESNNSRADVTIEDVRILRTDAYGDDSNQITQDVTVAMVSTDPGNVDLGVYFDQHSLVNEGDSQSNSITLTIGNQIEEPDFDAAAPLKDVPYTNVGFLVNGDQVVLALDLTDVETYDQLWAVIEASFDAAKAEGDFSELLANVTIERSIGTDTFFSKDGVLRSADEYLLAISEGEITPSDIGWTADGGLPSNNAFSANVTQGDVTVTSNLITSEIILDDVGRGSMGGDLIVGGLSIGTGVALQTSEGTSDSKGVEQFNITVERSSELQEIQSTNNTLEEVYIVNGDTNGDLTVAGDTNLGFNADDLPGSDANTAGFRDVRVLDASAMVGKVDINAELTSAVVAKYLDLKDDATDAAADNVGFMYDLGTNDDNLDLTISSDNLAAAGTTTREDFYLNVNGNAGDDTITTIIGDGSGTDTTNWYVNSKINANLTVNGGSGDDTIKTVGAGDFKINGDAGDDTVYANNDGNLAAGRIAEVQTLTFGAAGDLATQGQVTVTFSNGESFTTAGIVTGDTGATVAAAVQAAIAGGITGATAVLDDDTIVVTYNAGYAGPENVVNATISDLATDSVLLASASTASIGGNVATPAAVETNVLNFSAVADGTAGDTYTIDTAVITLVDTDANGTVSPFEIAQQVAAGAYPNWTVTSSNPSLGLVNLQSNTAANVVDLTVVGTGVTAPVITTVDGTDVAAAVDATTAATSTITMSGADASGTVTFGIDVDGSGAVDADELFDVTVSTGVAGSVAAQVATGINAIAGVTAVQGAAGVTIDDVIVTYDPSVVLGGTTPANITMEDGALLSASVAQTVQGVEATSGKAATWAVNAADVNFANLESNVAVANGLLYKSTVTVTYSGARSADSGVINDAADANSNGFESTVTIGTTNHLGSQLQVNQAIKEAINNDAVLSKLLMATDGPSNTLVITSLVDGRFEANDLAIDIAAPSSLSAAEVTTVNASYEALIGDSTANLDSAGLISVIETHIAAIDAGGAYTTTTFAQDAGVDRAGSTSTSDSDNMINLGSGDDVAVLGTDDTSNDTLVFEGTFGNDSIFNFDNTTGAAQDMLDFTAYLTNEVSASGSTASTVRVAITGENSGGASTLTANEVATLNGFASASGETWANLTAADLLKAIKGDEDYGNITGSTFDVASVTGLVGNVQNGIIMVENDTNDGEYKVFSTFANDSDAEFTAVTLVGTVDFGDSIDASVAGGLAQYMA